MTNQTPTPEQLQVMYNNFVKISQWLTKKEDAPSPLPPLYADILSELKALRDKVEDLEFKQAANLEEIHYLQGLIERKEQVSTPPVQAEPEPKKSKLSRKKKQAEAEEEQPSAPTLTPAPAPSQEQEASAEELSPANEPEPIQTETEPLDIELDSTVLTSVSEEVSKILDEINKRSSEDD